MSEEGRRRLLRVAALASPDRAHAAWREWRTDADPWQFDPASQWWLPLVWWNLRDVLTDTIEQGALRQEYRDAWVRNQHLLAHVAPLLGAFHREGIETLLLKGAALALATYERAGLRPFGDVDVLVRPEAVSLAHQILERYGWVPFRRVTPSMRAVLPSLGYTDPHGVDLDLHGYALAECCVRDIDSGFWHRAVPVQLADVKTHVLCPSDQLLHVCAHGLRFTWIPTAHWMADAATILRRAASPIAWDTFIAEARARRLTYQLHHTLTALETDQAAVPSDVIAELRSTRAPWWERVEYYAKRSPTRPSATVQAWCTEARSRAHGEGRAVGFTMRLQAVAGCDSHGQLARRTALAAMGLRRRGPTRAFDAYGRRIQIDIDVGLDIRKVIDAIDDRLPRFPRARRFGPTDRIYQILPRVGGVTQTPGYRVLVNRAPLAVSSTLDEAADHVVTDLQAFLALAAAGRIFVHAGVVSLRERAIVLPGESGSGKSTLVAALIRAGAAYASDEFAILDDAGHVHPYPRPLKLRHPGGADEHVRPQAWGARTSTQALPAALVLFTAFRPDGKFAPAQLSGSAAVLRLLRHCPGAQARPAETIAGLRALVEAAPAWATERRDTDTVVHALLEDSLGR